MKAGTCIAFFVIIFTCFQFSLWARYGNAWTAGNRFARRGYTTLSQKKMNTTEHASGVLQNGSEFRFVSLPSHESRLVEKEIRVSSLRPSTADKHDSEVINVRRKKHARHMKIKVALFNDKLIETQWGSSALIAGHGFQGNIKCELVHSCNFEIIPSANTDPNKFRSFDGIVHMAAKPQGNRLVSMAMNTNWGNRLRIRRKQFKILYAGEGVTALMDLYFKRYKFDAMINYRLSSEIFLGHGCEAIQRIASTTTSHHRSLYDPAEVFRRPGDVAIFVSNCVGGRLKWIRALIEASKKNLLKVDSFGSCFHNTNISSSRSNQDWFNEKMEILKRYKFSVAFENSIRDSYVSEKLFMSLEAGTIPLYYGTKKASEYVPQDSTIFLSRFMGDTSKFVNYLRDLTTDYNLFKKYFDWTVNEYKKMRIFKACQYNWQCSTCGWIARQKVKRRRKRSYRKVE